MALEAEEPRMHLLGHISKGNETAIA
jgi:hypothetical protein